MQSHRRSIVKAASYRVVATTTVFVIAFLFTGDLTPAAKIGLSAAVAKTSLYYLWERVWNRISWGLVTAPEADTAPDRSVPQADTTPDRSVPQADS